MKTPASMHWGRRLFTSMRTILKVRYLFPAVALFIVIFILIFNMIKNSDEGTVIQQFDKKNGYVHFSNGENTTREDQKEHLNDDRDLNESILPELQNKRDEINNDIDNNYNISTKNLKLKRLIEIIVNNEKNLPQYVWEPVKFSENDINEHIARLEKIILYSEKLKINNDRIEDKRILYGLISNEIKDKIEYFNTLCADVRQKSLAKNDEDQIFINDTYKQCKKKVEELEEKLTEYAKEY
jgi:hypothetical protein